MSQLVPVVLYKRKSKVLSDITDELQGAFAFFAPGYMHTPLYKQGIWDGKIKGLRKDGIIPTGLFLAMRREVEKKLKIRFEIEDMRRGLRFRKDRLESDRDYQNECLEKMIKKSRTGGLILSATGTGKTYIVGQFCHALKGTAMFMVDELTLKEQGAEALEALVKEKVGKAGGGSIDVRRITVVTAQTIESRLKRKDKAIRKWCRELDAIIIDEVHLAVNARTKYILKHCKNATVYGLTATMQLQKKNIRHSVYSMIGPVLYEYPLAKGMEEKYLSPGIVVSVVVKQADIPMRAYQTAYKKLITESMHRNDTIVAIVKEAYKQGKSICVMVHRIRHIKILSELLKDIPHELVYGEKDTVQRYQSVKKFRKKKLRLIICNQVFKKGIDLPALDFIVEASAAKDKNDCIQKYGRGSRLYEGKSGLIYIDICDRPKEKIGINRFSKASSSRRREFRAKGLTVRTLEFKNPKEVLQEAERWLDMEIKKYGRAS